MLSSRRYDVGHAGHIATGMRQTRGKPSLDGVGGYPHDDRDRRGGTSGGARRGRAGREERVDRQTDQLDRERREPFVPAIGPPIVEGDVPALDVVQLPEPLAKGLEEL